MSLSEELSIVLALCFTFVATISAEEGCVIVAGQLLCRRNPAAASSAEVKLYDKDGLWIVNWFDPDDLMAFSTARQHGHFELKGCASDVNWLPGLKNRPEPYLKIWHTCNDKDGEFTVYNRTLKFTPERNYINTVELDDEAKKD